MIKEAFSIARASTHDQLNTIPAQLALNQKYAHRNNLTIIKEFIIKETGWKSKRKYFTELVNEIEKVLKSHSKEHPLNIVFDKVDRLTRNVDKNILLLEEWRKSGILIMHFGSDNLVYHKDSPASDEAKFDMTVVFAKMYSNQIRDNVKRTFDYLKKQGKIIGIAPLGYLNAGGGKVLIDEERKNYVIRIFDLYAKGNYSADSISKLLYKEGLRSINNKKVSHSRIAEILKNEFYIGKLRGIPHNYPIFIDKAVFDRVQIIMSNRTEKRLKVSDVKPFLFRNILSCEKCGSFFSGYLAKGKYEYYRGTNRSCCYNQHVNVKLLEEPINEFLESIEFPEEMKKWIFQYLKDVMVDDRNFASESLSKLNDKLKKLEMKKDKIMEAYFNELYTEEETKEKKNEVQNEINDIKVAIAKIDVASSNILEEVMRLSTLIDRLPAIYKSSNIERKNMLLKNICSNYTWNGQKADIQAKKPFSFFAKKITQPGWRALADTLRTFDWLEMEFIEI